MASAAKRTGTIRKRKASSAGNKRKAKIRNQGTTPKRAELFGDDEKN